MLFVSQIEGPLSEDDFAAGCAQVVLPGLSERQITSALWTTLGSSGFYLHGFLEGDRSGDVSAIVERAGWKAHTVVLRNLINLPSGGRTTDCEMPFNVEAIDEDETYKVCTAQKHKITDNHNVEKCPVCGSPLK
jgi:hypothetical protein